MTRNQIYWLNLGFVL